MLGKYKAGYFRNSLLVTIFKVVFLSTVINVKYNPIQSRKLPTISSSPLKMVIIK